MQQVFAVLVLVTFVSSQALGQQQPDTLSSLLSLSQSNNACTAVKDASDKYNNALAKSGLNPNSRASAVREAQSCARKDSEFDPDDDEFSCADIESNCRALSAASETTLKAMKDDTKREAKETEDDLDAKLEEQADSKEDAARLAKEYAEREDDLNSDIVDAEKAYKEDLREKDREALEQVQAIQSKISEIANANREIVLKANRAMAELQAAKLNAKKTCREQARADYQATLKQLDEELAKRGGKVAGGFEGIQNAENYRKFLMQKIKNPEPSEQFTLCYSVGDAVETDLQQRNMGSALTMNEFTSQIEENNKQRDQLTQQLQQQQQLAQQQKIEGYQEHMKSIQALQKKILTNRQNFERESRALSEKQRILEQKISKLQTELGEQKRKASNAEDRYNCLVNKGLTLQGTEFTSGKQIYETIISSSSNLDSACGTASALGATCGGCPSSGAVVGAGGAATPTPTNTRSATSSPQGAGQ